MRHRMIALFLLASCGRKEAPHKATLEIEILNRLLDAKPNLNDIDEAGRTPLQYLAGLGRLKEADLVPLADLLVARGADRKVRSGATPAAIAEKRGYAALAKVLR